MNISKKQAEKYIEDYFETYPDVKRFMDELVEQGKQKGYVTSLFGRIRPIPEFASKNFMQRQFGERIAMNSPIQGTAADIIKDVYKRQVMKWCQLLRQMISKKHIIICGGSGIIFQRTDTWQFLTALGMEEC